MGEEMTGSTSAPMLCLEFVAGDAMSVSHEPPAYLKGLNEGHIEFESHISGGAGWTKIAWTILRTVFSRAPDLVLSCEYRRAFLVNLALILTRSRVPHIVLGMNLSAKPIVSRHRILQGLIDRIFARSTAIVVHSTVEATLFARLHNLPAERFAFSHWGFDLPADGTGRFDGEAKPYFCMIGRNNRDVDTFAAAIRKAGTRGIAILPSYLQLDPATEQVLQVYRDLPMSECVSCIRNAAANVTLLRDGSRGAGHITVVIAMHLGVPQIYSDTEVLREYFPTPGFGLPVPVGDKDEVARRMLEVLEQAAKPEGDRFIDARKEFALAWLSHGSSSRRLSEVVLATIEGRQPALIDPAWSAWLQKYRVGP
jgi:glycosyltransferase involved in cell wall biosynthesis